MSDRRRTNAIAQREKAANVKTRGTERAGRRRGWRGPAVRAAAALAAWSASGCDTMVKDQIPGPPPVIESAERYSKEYVLAAGDVVDVVVLGNKEVSRTCAVRPDGFISLPMLNDVKAEGLTVNGLAGVIRSGLSARLREPEVTVVATATRQPMVFVFGQVGAPKPVPLRDARTAAQALSYAGDFTQRAEPKEVALIRLSEEGRLRAYTITDNTEGQPAPYVALHGVALQADDLIVVPESGRSEFVRFVTDFVNTPLSGVNSVLTPYFQFKLIEVIERQ